MRAFIKELEHIPLLYLVFLCRVGSVPAQQLFKLVELNYSGQLGEVNPNLAYINLSYATNE